MKTLAPYIGTILTIAVPGILALAAYLAKRTKTKADDQAVEALSNIINAIRGGKK